MVNAWGRCEEKLSTGRPEFGLYPAGDEEP